MKGRLRSMANAGLVALFASVPAGVTAQACTSDLPPDSRSLAPIIDSAGLAAELAEVGLLLPGLTLASVTPDSMGAPRIRVTSGELSEDAEARLEEVVLNHVQSFERIDTARLVLAENAVAAPRRVSRFASCQPRLLNGRQVISDVTDRLSSEDLRVRRTVGVRLFIGPTGQVEEARIQQSSGLPAVDRAVIEGFRSASFTPAQVEGIPVPVWISLPITVGQRR